MRMSSIGYENFSFTKEQLAMLEERDQTIGDLQFSLDERSAQLEEVRGGGGGGGALYTPRKASTLMHTLLYKLNN